MRTILIIGATKGIGAEISRALLAEGDRVIAVARSIAGHEPTAQLQYLEGDLSTGVPDLATLPEVIDGVVYCPGSINLKPFHRLTEAEFLADWQQNVMGAIRIIQATLPNLKKGRNPAIVLFSTVAAGTGMPFHASIAASKAAVEGLTRSLAAEFAPTIRVNCIAPSLTNTPLAEKLLSSADKMESGAKRHPLQRIGQPADIAGLACFLLSEKAAWITGQIMHADGGMSAVRA